MFLAGPNGSGKSNFLDALKFAADALRSSLDHALRERGPVGGTPPVGRPSEPFRAPFRLCPAFRPQRLLLKATARSRRYQHCSIDRTGAGITKVPSA